MRKSLMKRFPSALPVSRREFLGRVSAGTALLIQAEPAVGQPLTRRKLGIALCGLGNYASDQLGPALKLTQNCELRGVVTGSSEKGAAWAKEYGFPQKNIYHYDTMARLVENLDMISSTSSRRTPCMRSMWSLRRGRRNM
jgi:glucose-fructose oxidoreductase